MLKVPYLSQKEISTSEFESNQICGIVCVKMILDFYNKDENFNINDLIKEGVLIKAFDKNINNGLWTHDGLVKILRNHGVPAYSREFRSVKVNFESEDKNDFNENTEIENEMANLAISKIKQNLKLGHPTIVSVKPNFAKNRDSHLVIAKGYKSGEFIFADPYSGNNLKYSEKHFLNYFRKFAIFCD